MDEKALQELRQQIDMIDRQLLRLLNERGACALKVADIKSADGRITTTSFYRPSGKRRSLKGSDLTIRGRFRPIPLSDSSERLFPAASR